MKSYLIIAALLSQAAHAASGDIEVTMKELQIIGYLPQDKEAWHPEEKIDPKKVNPFAERKKQTEVKTAEAVETEESKIRNFFDKQAVSGVSTFNGKHTVTLGRNIMLEEGQIVPMVIPGQTQILRVTKVNKQLVEIAWVEGVGLEGAVPRRIQKKIDLIPRVAALLTSASEDDAAGNNLIFSDMEGKAIIPRTVRPDPGSIVDALPPSSDSSASALTPEEAAQLDEGAGLPPVPDAAPPMSPEDKVVKDPDQPLDPVDPPAAAPGQ